MIDIRWLRRLLAFDHVDTGGLDAEALAASLQAAEEVLPFVITRGHGFSDWPQARQALARAAQESTRTASAPYEGRTRTLSPRRAALYDQMRAAMIGSDVQWQPDCEERCPRIDTLVDLVKEVRLDEDRGGDSPSMFIAAR
jgi:hypothetical protein